MQLLRTESLCRSRSSVEKVSALVWPMIAAQNARVWRRHCAMVRYKSRETMQGPYVLGSKALLPWNCLLPSHSASALTTPVLSGNLLFNSFPFQPWHFKCKIVCGKVELHEREKQKTNTLSLSNFSRDCRSKCSRVKLVYNEHEYIELHIPYDELFENPR